MLNQKYLNVILALIPGAIIFMITGCGDESPYVVEPACTPVCQDNQECGGDGCGGYCGTIDGMCENDLACDGFSCVKDPCPEGFVMIPAWTFMMGSPDDEPGRVTGGGDETLHKVTITRPFCMATTEVTNAQWTETTGTSPSFFADAGDDLPVGNINWYDAIAFLNMKSTADGLTPCYLTEGESGTLGGGCVEGQIQCGGDFRFSSVTRVDGCTGYRLPTEAEWELAARAGEWPAPDDFAGMPAESGLQCQSPNPRLDGSAWFCGNADATYESGYDCSDWSPLEKCGPQPVGTKAPNKWGLYDMLGNMFEFCQDLYWWHGTDHLTDPVMENGEGRNRIIRGGSWSAVAAFARFASRAAISPVDRGDIGLRMVMDIPSTSDRKAQARLVTAPVTDSEAAGEPVTGITDEEQEVVFAGPTYRVVSFNVMCSVCDNSYDPWKDRLTYFGQLFDQIQPDLVGLQEIIFDFEVDEVLAEMPGFAASFYPGDGGDYFAYPDAAVLYRTDRFTLLESGEYWLSPTPDAPWSMGHSPGQSIPRIVAWVKLHDELYGTDLYFATTHFDSTHPHQEHSAPQMLQTTEQWATLAPVIMTGDFNTEPRDPAYNILTNGVDATGFHMDDVFQTVGNYWNRDTNTEAIPAYDPINRIDHIMTAGGEFSTKWWHVDLQKFGDEMKFPSDHRLIWAEIVLE